MVEELKTVKEALGANVVGKPEAAWGGIGGSGKHAAEIMGELIKEPRMVRVLDDITALRSVEDLIKRQPGAAWGGIGGSGKHAGDIAPEQR